MCLVLLSLVQDMSSCRSTVGCLNWELYRYHDQQSRKIYKQHTVMVGHLDKENIKEANKNKKLENKYITEKVFSSLTKRPSLDPSKNPRWRGDVTFVIPSRRAFNSEQRKMVIKSSFTSDGNSSPDLSSAL